jgi:hypothetical protein
MTHQRIALGFMRVRANLTAFIEGSLSPIGSYGPDIWISPVSALIMLVLGNNVTGLKWFLE